MKRDARDICPQVVDQISSFVGLLVNPFYLSQLLQQLFGQLCAALRATASCTEDKLTWCHLELPFDGQWKVFRGGIEQRTSHSWGLLSQRYAYDFLIETKAGCSFRDNASELSDFLAWGQLIRAPTSGVILRLQDGWSDNSIGSRFKLPLTCKTLLGNHIVIQQDSTDLFVLIAHLQQGSCFHRVGDRVQLGEAIGRCGNSGMSTQPHVHLQAQDREGFFFAQGLPLMFESARVLPCLEVPRRESAVLQEGDWVEKVTLQPSAEPVSMDLPRLTTQHAAIALLSALVALVGVVVGVAATYYHLFWLVERVWP